MCSGIMDVLAHTEDGRRLVIEMQRADKRYIKNRLFYYGSSMIATQLKPHQSYGKLMPVYVICFMNFRLRHDEGKLIYTYMMREENGELYGNQIRVLLCELPRLISKPKKSMTPVEAWFDILQNMSIFAGSPEDYGERYRPILETCRQEPIASTDREQYLRSMIIQEITSVLSDEDREEAREEARAEGIAEVAKSLRDKGIIPVSTIAEVCGLSIEQVLAL